MCVCDVLHPHALRPTERESVPLLSKHPTSTSHEVSPRPQATPPHSRRGAHHVGVWSVCEGGWFQPVSFHVSSTRERDHQRGRGTGALRSTACFLLATLLGSLLAGISGGGGLSATHSVSGPVAMAPVFTRHQGAPSGPPRPPPHTHHARGVMGRHRGGGALLGATPGGRASSTTTHPLSAAGFSAAGLVSSAGEDRSHTRRQQPQSRVPREPRGRRGARTPQRHQAQCGAVLPSRLVPRAPRRHRSCSQRLTLSGHSFWLKDLESAIGAGGAGARVGGRWSESTTHRGPRTWSPGGPVGARGAVCVAGSA